MSRVYLGRRPFYGRTPAPLNQAIRAARAEGLSITQSRTHGGFAVYAII